MFEISGIFSINKNTFIGTPKVNAFLRGGKLYELEQELYGQKINIGAVRKEDN